MVLIDKHEYLTKEEKRLKEDRERTRYWKRWGPYVAERQWATGEIFPFFFRIVLENACNWLTCCSIIQFERIIRKFLFIFNVAE